jgi:hypothetical protein
MSSKPMCCSEDGLRQLEQAYCTPGFYKIMAEVDQRCSTAAADLKPNGLDNIHDIMSKDSYDRFRRGARHKLGAMQLRQLMVVWPDLVYAKDAMRLLVGYPRIPRPDLVPFFKVLAPQLSERQDGYLIAIYRELVRQGDAEAMEASELVQACMSDFVSASHRLMLRRRVCRMRTGAQQLCVWKACVIFCFRARSASPISPSSRSQARV